ncbi:hypothetical protein QWJ34_02060 [Saccharibacillus sp. CPCC 101409]|uniref:hypothetical protein n=1 Tax=Saccharibacillus sp. CPCC 101409 TaxID=3058041 RepID=UPI0026719EAB|nr:hypothetical protein [Saccharibacillus sp. CPCC 101409]MDO3408546.1 hypothetical protein [Saccharibacillus sp. CPCC 101409]
MTQKNRSSAAGYTPAELMLHAGELFGVREEVVSGALYSETAERFTVEQAAHKIKQFMKAKVK